MLFCLHCPAPLREPLSDSVVDRTRDDIVGVLQHKTLNKHFIYVAFDILLAHAFPEMVSASPLPYLPTEDELIAASKARSKPDQHQQQNQQQNNAQKPPLPPSALVSSPSAPASLNHPAAATTFTSIFLEPSHSSTHIGIWREKCDG